MPPWAPLGGYHRNIAMPFGTKLEWLGCPMVKKFWRYVYSFWQKSWTSQTDKHCMTTSGARPLLHSIAWQKSSKAQNSIKICLTTILVLWRCMMMILTIIHVSMCMVLSSWQSHCESSPGSFDECRMAPSGRRPKTKPDDLDCESACRLPESTPIFAIYYYSARKLILILLSHGG